MRQLSSLASVLDSFCRAARTARGTPQLLRILAPCLAIALCASNAHAIDDAARSKAKQLVAEAAQADIAGDKSRAVNLLHDALAADPENQLAHWQLGEVKADGKWVSVEEAQRKAAADPRQTEYKKIRTATTLDPQAQYELARWCRRNSLNDEAVYHWASVLTVDPNNEEALRALGMKWVDGQLMTHAQSAELKKQIQKAKAAAKSWDPIITKWRDAVAGDDIQAHGAALKEISEIDKIDVIPSMEAVTLGRHAFNMSHAEECLQIAVAFIDALEKMPDQEATESLARHAVISPGNKARALAAAKLRARPKGDYVPLLLSGLSMPIESSFNVSTDASGNVHYTHSIYQEGANADRSIEASYATIQNVLPGRDFVYRRRYDIVEDWTPSYDRQIAAASRSNQRAYGRNAIAVENQIARANRDAQELTLRILPVLASATGEDFNTPKQWWNWWRESNEYYSSEHPVERQYYSGVDRRYYGNLGDSFSSIPSCFTKGTPVWTKTGKRPIETLELGDLILSQDVETGELAYKPLIGRTVRPPSPIIKVSLDGDQVQATKGHPFWVSGLGWQMAKELETGAVLHGVSQSNRIHEIEQVGDAEAYNLVVADLNTYFVGKAGVLVHDNTPRQPTRIQIPGVAIK